ncbi:hypothetical protein A3F27_02580 [Candidatus Kaiserbacteria bacterium RIFCSPHIGHO2_12_FULL_53_13]|uniref:IMP cyclohydrolase n=1 Tax=Candidatus Kaiserbacteria bacterium RIFCSPHIGHO2_12_FULL_53_13 TaxID=1798502 RepID=A0A1F6E8G3_9BACT|nr:MAG: hypothetical protein A3F27_02580 [Candidatus Kaiserbacteria bacterium RIFCSPHIGHO2_12_FULL_53_13]
MKSKLKYGENPHQSATSSYAPTSDPLAIQKFKRLDGKTFVGVETSWISLTDLGRLIQVAERFANAYRKNIGSALPHFAALVKHGNPCGAAFGKDPAAVARDVWKGDPQAAFGGCLIATFPFTKKIAEALAEGNGGKMPFLSAIAAPSFEKGITESIGAKSKSTHFIVNKALAKIPARLSSHREVKSVRDVVLEQTPPQFVPDFSKTAHNGSALSGNEKKRVISDLSLAYAVCSASTSNTVTLVRDGMLVGNAVGQQKRVGSAKLALQLAHENGHDTKGAVAVSDSYFPFPDGVEVLAKDGIRAIYATSGSVRDNEVFARAAELGVSMFTVPDKEGRMFAGH